MLSPSLSRRKSTDSFDSLIASTPPPRSSSAFPFPQHEWPSMAGPASRRPSRRGSIASSVTSVGGALDTVSENRMGSVAESGQNAISTLLQPPIVRTGMLPHTSAPSSATHKPPTTRDIPPVALTNIPHVDPASFKPYLSQVGSLWNAFQRARAEPEKDINRLPRKDLDQARADDFAEKLERGLRREQMSRKSSSVTLTPTESPAPKRRMSGGLSRRKMEVTPLSTIPPVYFDEHFQLENPRTFDIVSERSEVVRRPETPSEKDANGFMNGSAQGPRKALATNAILQEKLSWYMDTVEVHLISSISSASSSFFAALGSLRELQSEAAESVRRIKVLREDLGNLDRQMALGGLKVINMKKRRENLRKLRDAVEQLNTIILGVTHCEELVESGEFVLALDRLDLVERIITGTLAVDGQTDLTWIDSYTPSKLIDLRELRALDGLADGMQQLRFRIGKGFEARFLETLLADIRQHTKTVPPGDTLQRWGSAFQRGRGDTPRPPPGVPAYMNQSNQVRQNCKASLLGLHRSRYTQQATAAFREAVMKEMKALIRQHLPSSSDDDTESTASISTRGGGRLQSQQEKSSILARNLRALEPDAAEELLTSVYTNVGEALRRLSTQVKLLLDVTSGASSPPLSGTRSPMRSPNLASLANIDDFLSAGKSPILSGQLQEELTQALDMSSLLGQAVDIAQTQITKVLKVRSEQTIRLPLVRFLRYFNLNRLFADECEAVSGRSGAALKGVVNSQISDFIVHFGDAAKQQLASTMDNDKWEAKDFGSNEEQTLARILQGMTADHQHWIRSSLVWERFEEEPEQSNGEHAENDGTTKDKARNATFDEQSYVLVESAIFALRGINDFSQFIVAIPSMTLEGSNSLLEYLKLFNSRSCQLILGAGATRSAGLRNINTKHLALASQALSFVIALMPYLREFIRRHAANSPSLSEFDKVKRLYQDHQVSIHEKLIDIMSGRATAHVKAMKEIQWDSDARLTSPFMETLTKETLTLHRVLSKHLPESTVGSIIQPVFESYREQWGKAFEEAVVTRARGKARMLRDAQLFETKLSRIDGVGDLGSYIIDIVNSKEVEDAEPATEEVAAADDAPES
ncbi:putative GARP complex component [Pseudovirgaria hyperparasitica]|uniref:Vacuolar protein sorting-associated protein 54 n=1 Tax=Pseudovirgaria hyperparasitica TaxID=470096 RepID=A0A6A6VW71_9PEZI|nr:putative GARP complex component [Pseudovirgaria hyperparasitica]KAF2754036.1 putative GARP complex component [Pseudovirgaria hyperparasitica]